MADQRPYVVPYHKGWEPRIKNVDQLASGTGARFLRCLIAHNGDLIARSWHRREPEPELGYMIFTFPKSRS